MNLFRYLSVLFLLKCLRAEAALSCYFYLDDDADKVLYSSNLVGESLSNPVCVRYCYKCEVDDEACSAADVQASATLDKYFSTGSLVELTTANMMQQNTYYYKKVHVCSTDGCNDYVEGYCDDPYSTSVVFYAPPPPSASPPPPPPTTTIETENSSSNNTTLIGAAVGAVSLPAIVLAIMKVFASKALRAFLLKFGGCGRWLADLIVPDTQGDVKKINVKMKHVEAFMLKQKLPRLVNTTPSLDESLIIVEKSKPLGRGGFGVVFKGNMLRSSTKKTQSVAVKCLFNPTQDPMKAVVPEDIAKQMNREATILCSLNHQNIIRIFGIVLNRGWIIMELCARGSLRSILLDKDNALETPELVRFASETATGVAYLHATDVSIIHGDLKADNVLVREDGSICLCDFGMSEAKDRSKSMTTAVGVSSGSGSGGITVQWSAPELLKGQVKDRASDVFALAVTLWEIFERKTPFGGMADMIVINQILAGIRPAFENTPSEFRTLIKKAWGDDAKSRPSAAQIACVLSN